MRAAPRAPGPARLSSSRALLVHAADERREQVTKHDSIVGRPCRAALVRVRAQPLSPVSGSCRHAALQCRALLERSKRGPKCGLDARRVGGGEGFLRVLVPDAAAEALRRPVACNPDRALALGAREPDALTGLGVLCRAAG